MTINASRSARYLSLGVPAAVLGTLASTLVSAPASAETAPPLRVVTRGESVARVLPTQAVPGSYTVQPGDTVSAIADRFGLRTVDVLSWNGLTWRSVIHPGQSIALTGASTPAAASPVSPAAGAVHTVVAGDTVYGIAQHHGTTVDAILAANSLTRASIIYPGQTLVIGSAGAPAATPAPVAAPAPATPSVGQTHTVVAGDTLFGIAQRYGTTTQALFAANGLDGSSIIYPGQKIAVNAAPVAAPAVTPSLTAALDEEQSANAAHIISIGRELGVSDRGIAIALATSMVESWMRNLDWGDRDSLGLFQQRPSTGWGTPEQVRDADRSIRVFYGGPNDPNGTATRGLLDIPGWESMGFSSAAQAVQISAYPDRYGQWEAQAYQWLALHG
ncbi:LysM peptidoglycan-binding domain-containing protein [Microbacterium sp.]|uniref:muramidase family protein n=1 Tax=Microbacterium sp. TaxID=51671 RepID=UPI002810BC84|nr:LysM peptidoglycan-binding domain-containing protein [Microbacterium sp.]